GVQGFLQRQLMPSNAPVTTSLRLTPTPPTPLPGTLIAPGMSVSGIPGVPSAPSMSGVHGMPSLHGMATPSPTTLGSATGQMHRSRGKAGSIVAALVVVATASAGITVVLGTTDQGAAGGRASRKGAGRTGTTGTGSRARGTTGTGTTGTGTTGTGTT